MSNNLSETSVTLPLRQTPLAAGSLTGLIGGNDNVTVTSVPAGTTINVVPLGNAAPRSPRRRALTPDGGSLYAANGQVYAPVLPGPPAPQPLLPTVGTSTAIGTLTLPPIPASPRRDLAGKTVPTLITDQPVTPAAPLTSSMAAVNFRPPSPRANGATNSAAIDGNSTLAELRQAGYNPVAHIAVNDGNNITGRYVKALDKNGQYVFVSLDTNGYTTISPHTLTMVEAKVANTFPLSQKRNAMECAGTDVCGVLFECPGGVCTLVRGDDLSPRETSFVYASQRAESAAVLGDSLLAYPIVKLSEIRANPQAVLNGTYKATRRIRASAFKVIDQELAKEAAAITALQQAFGRFNQVHRTLVPQLHTSIEQLEGYNAQYSMYRTRDPAAELNHQNVVEELHSRNEKIPKVLGAMREESMVTSELNDITSKINAATDKIERELKMVGYRVPMRRAT